jgi:predicted nucleic-acid-binding protein
MIGIDTNVLVRYLAQDDAAQSARATRLIESELSERQPGFVGVIVLVETCWVLKRLYGASVSELKKTVRDLLDSRQIVVEQREAVAQALVRLGEIPGDVADALILQVASAAGCQRVVTFDRKAAKLGMSLLR